MMNKYWRIWAKSVGEKAGSSDKEADAIAGVRTIIVLVNFTTCFFIMCGVIHHW
tara:strand:- start:1237 stop:1398 length:162 start_codon:yes stop_codon:yes gene_type:complete